MNKSKLVSIKEFIEILNKLSPEYKVRVYYGSNGRRISMNNHNEGKMTLSKLAITVNGLTKTVTDLTKTVTDLTKTVTDGFKRVDTRIDNLEKDIKDINVRLDYIVKANNLKDKANN